MLYEHTFAQLWIVQSILWISVDNPVDTEYNLGRKPLQADLLIVRKDIVLS